MPLRIVDLFSGCGGLSYGGHLAASAPGIEVSTLAAVDLWSAACATYEQNIGFAPTDPGVSVPLLEDLRDKHSTAAFLLGGPGAVDKTDLLRAGRQLSSTVLCHGNHV